MLLMGMACDPCTMLRGMDIHLASPPCWQQEPTSTPTTTMVLHQSMQVSKTLPFSLDHSCQQMIGAYNGQLATIVLLVEVGADCTITDNDGATPSKARASKAQEKVYHCQLPL